MSGITSMLTGENTLVLAVTTTTAIFQRTTKLDLHSSTSRATVARKLYVKPGI